MLGVYYGIDGVESKCRYAMLCYALLIVIPVRLLTGDAAVPNRRQQGWLVDVPLNV